MKAKWAEPAFDGEGARLFVGRWNSKDTRMVYTSQSLSLAALEMLVHAPPALLRTPWVAISADIAEKLVEGLDRTTLPSDWIANPGPQEVQRLGDEWALSLASAVLEVPSAVIPSESNYLINPLHPDFARISIGSVPLPFEFDQRPGTL